MTAIQETITDVERFRSAIARHFGLALDATRVALLGDLLQQRCAAQKRDPHQYLALLEGNPAAQEWRQLARELTVGETYFFRDSNQFRALREVALPQRLQARAENHVLRILSAGCSSGEEAYSLAICTRDALGNLPWKAVIHAIDVNPAALEKARRGQYSEWSLRETPDAIRQRWFSSSGNTLTLDESIRRAVTFQELNLQDDNAPLWSAGSFDIIFCRNVLMYFSAEVMQRIVARIENCLAPGGYLFLGHADSLRGLSHGFHLRHTHDTFYYQRKAAAELSAAQPPSLQQVRESAALEAGVEGTAGWVQAVREAGERIEAMRQQGGTSPGTASRTLNTLATAHDLLRSERYAEALDLVRALPEDACRNADVLLLHAALLTHSGALGPAEAKCRQLLAEDDLSAGAHYLLALCREGSGDRSGALEHDRMASYLDPGFAMPHLHQGLLARKSGNVDMARSELSQALVLLGGEDPARLLLFGGGFSRESLTSLCRAELQRCGGYR